MIFKNKKEIFLIDPAIHAVEQGYFKNLTKVLNYSVSYHFPALNGMQTLLNREKETAIAALVVLGSYASVYEKLLWQDIFRSWLKIKLNSP